jgi:hypothetical protein
VAKKLWGKSGRTWSDKELKDFYMSAKDDRPGLEEKTEIARQGKNPTPRTEKAVTSPEIGGR